MQEERKIKRSEHENNAPNRSNEEGAFIGKQNSQSKNNDHIHQQDNLRLKNFELT